MPNIPNRDKIKFSIISIFTIMFFGVIIVCSILSFSNASPQLASSHSDSVTNDEFQILSRTEWNARSPKEPYDNLVLPVHRVIIAHTATQSCSNQTTCSNRVHMMQDYHMDNRNFNDIIYNFLVGGDGTIYEGRGWDFQGAHTKGYNRDGICIALIGTFTTLEPPERQLSASKWLLDEGVRLNKLVTDFKLYGARQLTPTESPGGALYEIIQKWPHWSNTI